MSAHSLHHANGGAPPDPGLASSWLGLARRRWVWGAAVFAAVVGATLALIVVLPPVHRAEARLRLADPPPTSGVSPTTGTLSLLRMGGDPFANDLQLLDSRTLREKVVAERALAVRLVAPRGWHRDSLLVSLSAGPDTREARFQAAWTEDGRVLVRRTQPGDSAVGAFAPGEPARFGGVTAVFRPRRAGAPARFDLVTVPFGDAVRRLESQLKAQRASRESNVLDLRYDDPDPGLAEGVVASAVAHFVALRTVLSQRESGETVDSLRRVAGRTVEELREAETRLEALQRESGLVAPEAQTGSLVDRYTEAVRVREAARAELDALVSALARVDAAANPPDAWLSLAAHPRFVADQTAGQMLRSLTLLEQQRIVLAGRLTPESVEYAAVQQQIDFLDASLRALARSYRLALEEQVRVLEAQLRDMEGLLAAVPGMGMELLRRESDVRLLSEVVLLTEQRLRQEELRQALTFANVQVVDPAAVRQRPVWPRPKLFLAGGLLLAVAFGALGMVVVERADGSVRSARGLRSLTAHPLLAAVPEGLRNGRPALRLSSDEVQALLRRGRVDEVRRAHLALAAVGSAEDAEVLARALEGGAVSGGDEAAAHGSAATAALTPAVTVLAPVDSYAAAEAAARRDVPVMLVLRAGGTQGRDVARVLELLEGAGAQVAGGVLLCRTPREARFAWR